ncbi:MAG: zinc ribbon domain-containing protein [Desulfobacterium sp.]|nr:zinc ribbon domain-containing protein [Desulfobacterium sp.]
MPIYEFKCSDCEEFFEVIVMKSDEEREIKCPKCTCSAVERVVSASNYAMGSSGSSGGGQAQGGKQERTCSSGSCTTYSVPGETQG